MAVCLVCQGDFTLFGPCSGYTYYRCRACGTIQLSPMPDEAELVKAYETEYVAGAYKEQFAGPEWWRRASRTYCASIVQLLKDRGVNGLVVDYGAGWGHLVDMMIQNGFDARGIELSQREVTYAQQRGLPVQQGDLSVLRGAQGQISAITMVAVFEHLVNHAAFLSAVHNLLKDDGLFITMHPTAAMFNLLGNIVRFGDKTKELPDLAGSMTAPWHTVLFSIDGTEQFVSRQGFQLLEIRPAPQGRLGGLLGLVQVSLELVNKIGWRVFGTRWPLLTTHIFVFRKVSGPRVDSDRENTLSRRPAWKIVKRTGHQKP
jgi:SAM-dependent methyltransferase